MTSYSPRIYLYKITFEEVPYYYYGVHKEKVFDEEYWGTPVTHKWCWELYTPNKQVLQVFSYTDEGWIEAQKVEKRIIKPVYNTDKWCLNENCGGIFSIEVMRKNGLKNKENGTGFFKMTKEEILNNTRNNGLKAKENGTGIFALTPEQRSENSRKIGLKNRENGTGIFSQTPEQRRELGSRNGIKTKEKGTGIFGMTSEQKRERSIKGGTKTSSQRWECLETGFVSGPGPLTIYQKSKGIDTSKRRRIS